MTDFTLGPGPLTPEFEQVKSDIGIVENGNTATHAIPAGYYVIWKGDLYVAKTDISSGTALSTSNLTAKTQGIGADVSALNSSVVSKEFTPSSNDSLLTWILSNIKRSTLPFSFVKVGGNVMSDIPAFSTQGSEFTGIVFGNARRMTVTLSRYANGTYEKWSRNIFDDGWYGSWERLAPLGDVPLGTTLTGSWITASTSATLVKLTNSITLTKGTWLILVTIPVTTEGTPNVAVGPQISNIDNNQFGAGLAAGGQAMRIVNVASTQEVYAMSAGSAPVTYNSSYFARGGIRAVKIGL